MDDAMMGHVTAIRVETMLPFVNWFTLSSHTSFFDPKQFHMYYHFITTVNLIFYVYDL